MSDQPPENGKDAYTRDRMQRLASLIDNELPDGWGFFVMAFPFGDAKGRMNYVSNAKREDVHRLMREFLSKGGQLEGHR